jgi:hypothetical protein
MLLQTPIYQTITFADISLTRGMIRRARLGVTAAGILSKLIGYLSSKGLSFFVKEHEDKHEDKQNLTTNSIRKVAATPSSWTLELNCPE